MKTTNFGRLALWVALAGFAGCSSDDGRNGTNGTDGDDGAAGLNSLLQQTALSAGDAYCTKGGVRIDSGVDANANGRLDPAEMSAASYLCNPSFPNTSKNFNRLATFAACAQGDACGTDAATATEIVAASSDGMTLIYTDSPGERVGFVDITNPAAPAALGTLSLTGEPTSVAVKGEVALVGIDTSADFVNPSGALVVVNVATRTIVHSIDMGGQPDAIAVSPDGNYAVVIIENQRDEDLGEGVPPQLPAGYLMVVSLTGAPTTWSATQVALTGLAELYPTDPEPEYVDINSDNMAVVTLQENNHLVLVDLTTATVTNHFSAGSVSLTAIDTEEEDPALVSLTGSQADIPREPDGVAWINNRYFATADEGDLDGGSRTFTVFNTAGEVVFTSGRELDHLAVRAGHYPDGRSGNKGNEPENIEVGVYGGDRYLFIASERASLVLVYDVADPANPIYRQTLPAALGPEGLLALPARNLLIAASEEDSRGDGFRAALNIYNYVAAPAAYPTLVSVDRIDGTPIPWSAMSGLAADPVHAHRLYAVDDSFYQQNRIFTLDMATRPARIVAETYIVDSADVFAGFPAVDLADATVASNHATRANVFDEADLALLINADKTVNIDPEGVALASDGGFWVASEGAGTVGEAARPVMSLNWVFKTSAAGDIEQVFTLPDSLNASQVRFGFEGITEADGLVYVAMQRAWGMDAGPRIAVLNPADGSWVTYIYPLESATRGWVGLSDITALGDGQFLVLERDNQAGPDAVVKRLYRIDLTGLADGATVTKTLARDLLPALIAEGGLPPEKIEGLAMTAAGEVIIINDNDGVDDNSGETLLLNLGPLN